MLGHRVAQRSYPQGKSAAMKWVIIIEIWYKPLLSELIPATAGAALAAEVVSIDNSTMSYATIGSRNGPPNPRPVLLSWAANGALALETGSAGR
jgi:hypothetical protein